MNIAAGDGLEDIEDLALPDGLHARQNKKYVLARAIRHNRSAERQTCTDSIIPGINIYDCCQCHSGTNSHKKWTCYNLLITTVMLMLKQIAMYQISSYSFSIWF